MQALAKTARAAARTGARAPSVMGASLRWKSGGKKGGEAAGVSLDDAIAKASSNEELTAIFDSVDAKGGAVEDVQVLPVNMSGAATPYVETAWSTAGSADGLAAATKQLQALHDLVTRADYSIGRFFIESDYLPQETELAVNLLTTNDVSLKNIDKIEDDDLREYFLVDEEIAGMWADARAAVKDLKLNKTSSAVLAALAADGNTAKLGRVVEGCNTVLAAVSTVAQVTVQSAVPLTNAQQKEVQAAVKSSFLPEGKTSLEVSYDVDPALVGGLMVHIDDNSLDLSAAAVSMAMAESMGEARA